MINSVDDIKFIFSEWDTEQFGFPCGIIDCSLYSNKISQCQMIERINSLIDDHLDVNFITLKISCFYNDILNDLIKRNNFKIIDTELIFKFMKLQNNHSKNNNRICIVYQKSIDPEFFFPLINDINWSRFFLDTRINKENSIKMWKNSLINHCSGRSDDIAIAYINKKPAGIIFIKSITSLRLSLFFVGVLNEYRKKGIASELLRSVSIKYGNTSNIFVETSSKNIFAQRLYQKNGFILDDLRYIIHYVKI